MPKFTLLLCLVLICSCSSSPEELSQLDLLRYQLEPGFEIQLVAREPKIIAPVAFDFDLQGRLWVAEMTGYMSDLEGSEEQLPTGSIKILEDRDGDGITEHVKTFLDSLKMPRAVALVYGGLLYVEPPNLWFVEINEDRPGQRQLVDSTYAISGNPERQPNGLLLNVDNWIYSAISNARYRREGKNWIKQPTSYRGQWGLTRDDYGRLYYNNNSVQLLGDYVLPNTIINNQHAIPQHGLNRVLTQDQRIYPAHATSVNRGYLPGILDQDSLLINVTASCSPWIYRESQFPDPYYNNVFVCVPEANLIKRLALRFDSLGCRAEEMYHQREFLTSVDELFRPVFIKTGPDGALYIADLHRGIIEHRAYMTPYLRQQIESKRLDTAVNMGRIIRIVSSGNTPQELGGMNRWTKDQLVEALGSPSAWQRDQAQQLLIRQKPKGITQVLEQILHPSIDPLKMLHGIYTLEGLNALNFPILLKAMSHADPLVASHGLVLSTRFASSSHAVELMPKLGELLDRQEPQIDLYLPIALQAWQEFVGDSLKSAVTQRALRYQQPLFGESLLTLFEGREQQLLPLKSWTVEQQEEISDILARRRDELKNPIFSNSGLWHDPRTIGLNLYTEICAACHGHDGRGLEGLAPPLMGSEYVSGDTRRLASIILHGLTGPIEVSGEMYDFNNPMPGLVLNQQISDGDIQDIIGYLQSAFVRDSQPVLSEEEIRNIREKKPPHADGMLRAEDLH